MPIGRAMKLLKITLAVISILLIFFGIVYNLVALPFSSPLFDIWAWTAIAIGFAIALLLGRGKS